MQIPLNLIENVVLFYSDRGYQRIQLLFNADVNNSVPEVQFFFCSAYFVCYLGSMKSKEVFKHNNFVSLS